MIEGIILVLIIIFLFVLPVAVTLLWPVNKK